MAVGRRGARRRTLCRVDRSVRDRGSRPAATADDGRVPRRHPTNGTSLGSRSRCNGRPATRACG